MKTLVLSFALFLLLVTSCNSGRDEVDINDYR